MQFLHDVALFVAQPVWVFRVYGGEEAVAQRVFFAVDHDCLLLEINAVQQHPVFHPEFGAAADDFSFQLELDDADGFVHLGNEADGFLAVCIGGFVDARAEERTRVAGISFHGKGGERQEVDAVSVFQHGEVAVAHGKAQHVGYVAVVSRSRPHPEDVVVPPLDVEVVVIAEGVHDDVRAGAAVENIA